MVTATAFLPPRYRGARRIAQGGMGEIYRATDSTLGRAVAIKVLAERYADHEELRNRFKREALAAARLSGDPSIVTIFDVGEQAGRPYIVMEYFAGGSVAERLASGTPSVAQSLEWLDQAARALDHAHAEGIVHRDVKPANLLLDREGNVHVADFGIASAAGLDSLTMTGTVMGTAGYLSPEQARGERATPASDRYALGVVAFELLAGSRPFEGESVTAEASAHVHAPVPSASDRNPDLPREIDEVFERALAKNASARYRSCAELVAELRHALTRAAGATRPLAPATAPTRQFREAPPAAAPSRRSRPLWPLLLGGLAAAAIAGAGLAAVLSGGDEQTTPPLPTTVVHTVTTRGTTIHETVVTTVARTTTAQQPQQPPQPVTEQTQPAQTATPAENPSTLNDRGFELMQQGDYESAMPLLESAVAQLAGTGSLTEAYASYNLAYTRYQSGNCDGVLDLLDRSQAIQGHREEIVDLRKQAKKSCRE